MGIYWRISSFPELQHLSPQQRRELLRNKKGVTKTATVVVLAMILGALVAGVGALFVSPESIGGLACVTAVGLLGVAFGYRLLISCVRDELRSFLEVQAREGMLVVCLRCYHDLRGLHVEECPNCHKPLPMSGEEGLYRQASAGCKGVYWRVRSFPELANLSEKERQELLRMRKGMISPVARVAKAVAMGGNCTIGLLTLFEPQTVAARAGAIVCGLVIFALFYLMEMRIARIWLRARLIHMARGGKLSICLHCGYNLKGLESDRCPECGAATSVQSADDPDDF